MDTRTACLLSLLAACDAASTEDLPLANGQTGSPGAVECEAHDDCLASAEAVAAALREPSPAARSFVGARCVQQSVVAGAGSASGPACACDTGSGSVSVGPEGLGCYARGRAGACLFDDSEFSGCDVDDATSCEAVCATLARRYADDAATPFEASVLSARCVKNTCHNVLEVDGACHPQAALDDGSAYDCALGAEAILAAHAHEQARAEPPDTEVLRDGWYVAGTRGFAEVGVYRQVIAGWQGPVLFGANAQFADTEPGSSTREGTVLDPLEGLDDCGVFVPGVMGSAPGMRFFWPGEASIADGSAWTEPLIGTIASHAEFSQMSADMSAHAPRYGHTYTFRASGGGLSAAIAVPITLPERLEVTSLAGADMVDKGALELTWTGSGEDPLTLVLSVTPALGDPEPYTIQCRLRDDGAFTVPESVLRAAPSGLVDATFIRRHRAVESSGGSALLAVGTTQLSQRFALRGPADAVAQGVRAACLAYREHERALRGQCGDVSAMQPEEAECPALLDVTPGSCADYYACMTARTTCTEWGVTVQTGCRCD